MYGPFTVLNAAVHAGVVIHPGDTVRTRASGIVNFGGGVGGWFIPSLTADGDTVHAPDDYPAPALRKNSLICGVAGVWHQGGTNASFVSDGDGELVLMPNDRYLADNTGFWSVNVDVTRAASSSSTTPQLGLGWVEPVQVIQTQRGTVPLIAGKRTVLRLFFTSGLGSSVTGLGPAPGTLGPIEGLIAAVGSAGSTTLSFSGATAFAAGTHDRGSSGSSLSIELPLDLTQGPVTLAIHAAVTGHASDPSMSFLRIWRVAFQTSRSERMLPLLVVNVHQGLDAPPLSAFTDTLRGARRMLPLAEDAVSVADPVLFALGQDFSLPISWTEAIIELAFWSLFQEAGREGIVAAIISAPGGASGGIGTSIPRGVFLSSVHSTSGWNEETFAHEWMHAYGQLHANACGAPWPYDDRIDRNVDEPGFDFQPSPHVVLATSMVRELMAYCQDRQRWPSTSTYMTAVNALRA